MRLSANFTLAQLTRSEAAEAHGIDNSPPPEIIENLKRLAAGLEEVRALLGAPLEISSAYRGPGLNAIVGGTPASQHLRGLAADLACPQFGEPLAVARRIAESDIAFDQCIVEFGRWVHLSFSDSPRRRLLTIHDALQGYLVGLWDAAGKRVA